MRNGIFLFVVFFSLIGVNTCETELLSTCNMAGKMMKAVIAEAGKLVLVERPVPAVKVGEVLVKVHFTAINRADTLQRKGLYPVPAGQTDIFGLEMSGVVEGKDGETWKAGTEVMSLLNGGGYAEYVAVNENLLMPVPKGLDLRTAAGIPETWLTAFQLLHTVTGVKSGDTVVVHAGGSGVGTAATQLAVNAGCRVFVTAGTQRKIAKGVELGAAGGANYKEEDWAEKVLEMAGNDGVQSVLDCVGSSYWKQNAKVLSVDGRWTLYGLMGGANIDGPLLAMMLRKRLRLEATTLRSRSDEYKAELTAAFADHSLGLIESGEYSVIVDEKSFSLNDVQLAHDYMESNANIGKILVQVAGLDGSL